MATRDLVRKFAEQALQIDCLLSQRGVNGSAGRVILILDAASKTGGATQKRVISETSLAKDVVSKQIKALVNQKLLTQKRDADNPQIKRLYTTDAGRELMSAVKKVLLANRGVKPDPVPDPNGGGLIQLGFDLESLPDCN